MELRQRNLLSAADMPYTTPHGIRYDSGDPRAAADAAIALADVHGFASRRAESESRGMLRGIGIANGIEILNVFYNETAWLELRPDGSLLCRMGTQSSGQGHATVYAQLVSEQIGIEIESVTVAQGDTRDIAYGNGTGASRSLSAGGSAAVIAARVFVEAASALVAEMEGCPIGDVSASNGLWQVAGTNRSYGLGDLARLAGEKQALERLAVEGMFKPTDGTYPYGCDICEVEVDPETGEVAIMSFACVHDVGRAINHAIIDGQVHGSTLQGLGQALLEHLSYDPQGQLLTGSFMDYAMPTAGIAPRIFRTGHLEIASPANPLGAKGVGESGTTGAPPALINAIIDALSPLGVEDIAMPATPFRIWKAIQRAGERPT
jgi:carbon-monoxide dehydrogenase large subunit